MNRCKGCCHKCRCGLMERPQTNADARNGHKNPTWRSRRRFMEHVAYLPTTTDNEDEASGSSVMATSSISLLHRIQPVKRMTLQWEAKLEQEVEEKPKPRQSRRYQDEKLHQVKRDQVFRENVQVHYWRSKKTFHATSEQRLKQDGDGIHNNPARKLETPAARNPGSQGRDSYIESESIKTLLRDSGDYTSLEPPTHKEDARDLPATYKQDAQELQATDTRASPGERPTDGTCTVVDKWYMSCDSGSLLLSRRVVTKDGSHLGAENNLACAIQAIKNSELREGQRCVDIVPEEYRRYMTFFSDQRLAGRGFVPEKRNFSTQYWWWNTTVADLKLRTPLTMSPEMKVKDAIDIMKRKGFGQMPVVDGNGEILGMVTLRSLLTCILNKKLEAGEPIVSALDRHFTKVFLNTTLGQLTLILKTDDFVLVIHSHIECTSQLEEREKEVIIGIVTQIDLLNYITGVAGDGHQTHDVFYETSCVQPMSDSTAISIQET